MSAEDQNVDIEEEQELGPGKIPFRRFFYRGYEVHKLLDLTHAELMKLLHARARRHFARGSTSKACAKLMKRLRAAKKDAPENEKPDTIKTHLRNTIILPEMVASVVGVYNGLNFTQVEVKPDMVGHYLGEFAITYKPCKHGRAGLGGAAAARFVPLK